MRNVLLALFAVTFASCAPGDGTPPANPTGADFSNRGAAVRAEYQSRIQDMKDEIKFLMDERDLSRAQAVDLFVARSFVAMQMKIEKLYQLHGIKAGRGFDGKFEAE